MKPKVLLLACSVAAVEARAQAPVVRDSAGVRIVENRARASAPVRFTLASKARVDVGGLESDPDTEFNPMQGYLRGAWLANGGLAVIDEVRLHLFGADGKRQSIVGRKGKGPGEFIYITSICRTRGDTLVINDQNSRRTAIVTGSGTAVRTFLQDTLGAPPFSACLDDGTVVLTKLLMKGPGVPSTSRLTRVRLDGTVVNPIGTFDAGTFDMVTQSAPTTVARGQLVYWGDPRTSQIQVFNAVGKLVSIVRSADVGAAITGSEVEQRFRSTIPRNTPEAEVTKRLDRMRSLPHATHWPTYREIHVDPTGQLWVQDYVKAFPSPDGWTLFDAKGVLVGRLVIPAPPAGERPMQVISFGTNEVLMRRSDADGAAHLTVYPIIPVAR